MCSMTYLYRDLLPHDDDFSKQYARAFELRNEYWADELIDIADDGRIVQERHDRDRNLQATFSYPRRYLKLHQDSARNGHSG